jgi:hypothetical protein
MPRALRVKINTAKDWLVWVGDDCEFAAGSRQLQAVYRLRSLLPAPSLYCHVQRMSATYIACLHTEVAPTNLQQLTHVKLIGSSSQV